MSALCCAWCARAVNSSRQGHWTGWATEVSPNRWMCRVCRRRGSVALPEVVDVSAPAEADLLDLTEQGVRVVSITALKEGWLYMTRPNILLIDDDISREDVAEARSIVLERLGR